MDAQQRDLLKVGRTVGLIHETQGSLWGRIESVDDTSVVLQTGTTRFTLLIEKISDVTPG